jgi:hypothetical protein
MATARLIRADRAGVPRRPAVIEEAASVTILNPGQRLAVDDLRHLVIEWAKA